MDARSPDSERHDAQTTRLAALRAELARRGLDGFVVPRADAHQGEYVPPHDERLAWLTGFTGSAGVAVALADRAAIFVDGRYTLQVADQVDTEAFAVEHLVEAPPPEWLAKNAPEGGRIGFDPWLHTEDGAARLEAACRRAGAEAVAVDDNPLDAAWTDQPPPPRAPIEAHPLEYAGRAAADKRAEIAASLAERGIAAAVLTLPDSIAWLLNVRGGDVPHTPVPLAFAILHADATVALFADPAKVDGALRAHLGDGVEVRDPGAFGPALAALAGRRVLADPVWAARWVFDRLRDASAEIVREADPCQLPKACKNPVELDGTRAAHRRDGVALTRFLAWLAREAKSGGPTEIEAADRLEALRRESNLFRDLSFDTISGAGPDGAIVHYRVTPDTDRRLEPGTLYLVDSGAQYPDGTTDVTRTVAIGTPTPAMRRHFTLVLRGHIALARVRFPAGTSGAQLDVLARQHLWRAGLDYDHGTGHGVGSYLAVHEGPQRISKLPNTVGLKPGMIVSDEPGYYRAGEYGIRIENLVAVVEAEAPEGAEKPLLGFETLTLAPIDQALVDRAMLSAEEVAWLDGYHARVRAALADRLDAADRAWLERATAPI
jgi:Xaa-Pro aminopeptidase